MPAPLAVSRWITLCSLAVLAACGGSGGGPGAPAAPAVPPAPIPPAPATTLTVSVSSLALAANIPAALPAAIPGNPRDITVANTGTQPALAVTVDAALLPVGTVVSANTCVGALAAAASCTITITPGTVVTTLPVTLTVRGNNTNTVSTNVEVLGYGSIYQGGAVYSLDDTTPPAGSVGGKAMARFEALPGLWSPLPPLVVAADNLTDGAANSAAILAAYSDPVAYPATTVAAKECDAYSDAGYSDWHVPAICEMGYDQTGAGTGCGSSIAPLVQNVQSNLVDSNIVAGVPGEFWSSTQAGGPGTALVWAHRFEVANTYQVFDVKNSSRRLLCVRALTY
ncbi:hypothetical protein [Hydrogenophaga sp.]|uniref:hypothetical protein n=1 Tax=Hydrogenophaga sp. TaxID=1904254 RepID=UPI0027240D4D|nr:hypothetical protein [Hydrogenophaga sp.]MDO9438311.1 hypothetical protein [Hydrogenophaga sp.]